MKRLKLTFFVVGVLRVEAIDISRLMDLGPFVQSNV